MDWWYNLLFFFKRKSAYVVRISDLSSDVCSSDLSSRFRLKNPWCQLPGSADDTSVGTLFHRAGGEPSLAQDIVQRTLASPGGYPRVPQPVHRSETSLLIPQDRHAGRQAQVVGRSEEHTSELQSLIRISYAVFCLKKKKNKTRTHMINTKNI